jgi:hypothetical protein
MQTTFLQLRKHQYSPGNDYPILFFGTHYRKIYGTLIDSKTASLDTLWWFNPQTSKQVITIN